MTRKKRVTLLLAALAAFLFLAHSTYRSLSREQGQRRDANSATSIVTGMLLPADLRLESVDSKSTALGDYRGKVLLLNFWAGWCGPCLHEMPGLYDLQKRLGARGFTVLAVNMDDDLQSGLRTLRKVAGEAPFPIFRGAGSPLADHFVIEGLPFTVVVDKTFHVAYAQAGEVDWGGARAQKLIEGLL